MELVSADHASYLESDELSEASEHVETLRRCLVEIFENKNDIEATVISGLLIEYGRDIMLPALGAIRRNATANLRTIMSPKDIATATGLSLAVVSRLITESRSTR